MKRFILILLLLNLVISPLWAGSFNDRYYKRGPYKGWKYIVIHHSATTSGSARAFDRYHTKMGYGGLCYHFVIGNGNGAKDGEVATGFRWRRKMAGTHCSINAWDYNIFGIGICLVGNFEENRPTAKQMESLKKLVRELTKKYNIPLKNVIPHKDVPYDNDPERLEATACPGRHLSVERLRASLWNAGSTGQVVVVSDYLK